MLSLLWFSCQGLLVSESPVHFPGPGDPSLTYIGPFRIWESKPCLTRSVSEPTRTVQRFCGVVTHQSYTPRAKESLSLSLRKTVTVRCWTERSGGGSY